MKRFTRAILCVFAASLLTAASSYQINYGTNQNITEWSTCKNVANSSPTGKALFVPTNTSTEWSQFYSNAPAGVTISDCPAAGLVYGGFAEAYKTTSGTNNVTVPAGVAAGDLLVFFDLNNGGSSLPTLTYPSGFTALVNKSVSDVANGIYFRWAASYKRAAGNEGGTNIHGMTVKSAGNATSVVAVFKGPFTTYTPGGWVAHENSLSTYTLPLTGVTAPFIVIAWGAGAGVTWTTFSPAGTNVTMPKGGILTYRNEPTATTTTQSIKGGNNHIYGYIKYQ